jgi:hypothetical protein
MRALVVMLGIAAVLGPLQNMQRPQLLLARRRVRRQQLHSRRRRHTRDADPSRSKCSGPAGETRHS